MNLTNKLWQVMSPKLPGWSRHDLEAECAALREKVELKDELLQRIADWCVAYPLEVFPKPDVKASVKALHDAGLSYDAISANAMRHVVEGIAKIISPPEEQNHE